MNRKKLGLILGGVAFLALNTLRRTRQYALAGRTVLITGGSRGLGLVLARQLLAEGCRVAICARDPVELERALEDHLAGYGSRVIGITCDVGDVRQVAEMVDLVHAQFGPIDVLINNAAVISVGPVEEMDRTDYALSMRTHFWAPLNCIEAVLPEMRLRGEGRIVNITSIGGKIAVPHLTPYSAGKFAHVALSEGLRAELAKDGIVVTTIVPGLMRTGSPRNALFKGKNRLEYTWFHLSDALPPFSMSAERAARKIIKALQQGRAELVLSLAAKAAVTFHGLFPGLTADILGMVNRVLPGPGGIGSIRVRGAESETLLTRSWLTGLSRLAEARNNEQGHNGHAALSR